MNYILQYDRRSFEKKLGEISKSNDILTRLETKMTNFFSKKNNVQPRLMASDMDPQDYIYGQSYDKPIHFYSNFKLFPKRPASNPMKKPVANTNVYVQTDEYFRDGSFDRQFFKGVFGYIEVMEQIFKKKLYLKEEKVRDLEREIEAENVYKVHLYNLNTRLEQSVVKLREQNGMAYASMISELKHEKQELEIKYEQMKSYNKRQKTEEQLLRETLKTLQKTRKEYVQRSIKSQSYKQYKYEYAYLRDLVSELDRLKVFVAKRIKHSTSRKRIK